MRTRILPILFAGILLLCCASAQNWQNSHSMPAMGLPGHDLAQNASHDKSGAKDMPDMGSSDGSRAMRSMEVHHMRMGPHLMMTAPRAPKLGDKERVKRVLEEARRVVEKYDDYKSALADGFQIFQPKVLQKMYHFTNYSYAYEAEFRFNPDHPTSLLYERQGEGYKVVGVMYTAPARFNESDLDQRIPLSMGRWHLHVNVCVPLGNNTEQTLGPHAKFGLAGSITTKEECDANGGKFMPTVFNWMVHVYPLEKEDADIWAVEPRD